MRLIVLIIGILLSFQIVSANNYRQRPQLRTLSGSVSQNNGLGVQQRTASTQYSTGDSYGQQQQQYSSNAYSTDQQKQGKVVENKVVGEFKKSELEPKVQVQVQGLEEPVINEQKVKETLENAFSSRIIQTQPMFEQRIVSVTPVMISRELVTPKSTTVNSFVNPCTAEVLRMSDIMLFKDPTDRRSYLICTDVEVFHSMPCPEGTLFNDDLHHCVPEGYEAPKCPDSFCKNDADCLIDETNSFKCICKVGFTGQFCETNIDECALGGHQSCNGGTCVDQINAYYCIFRSGLVGLREDSAVVNPCTVENFARDLYFFELPSVNGDVWLQCVAESRFVVSRCAEHLFWNSELQTCTIERPQAKSGVCRTLPCKNGGECQDLGNSKFECQCRQGFTGEFCEETIDLCSSNPCASGGRCLSWTGGFTCVCQNKIIDETCTSGVSNPCPSRANLLQGFNDYFAYTTPERYLQCDKEGRAFVRSCPSGLKWNQEKLSCVPASFMMIQEVKATTVASIKKMINQLPVQETPRMISKETVTPKMTAQPIENFVHMDQQVPVRSQSPLVQMGSMTNSMGVNLDQQTKTIASGVRLTPQLDETLNQTVSNVQRLMPTNFQQSLDRQFNQDLRSLDEVNRPQQVITKMRSPLNTNQMISNDMLNNQQQMQQQQPQQVFQQNTRSSNMDRPLRYNKIRRN